MGKGRRNEALMIVRIGGDNEIYRAVHILKKRGCGSGRRRQNEKNLSLSIMMHLCIQDV